MGMDQQIGSLEMGKQADIIAVDLSGPECQPLYNPLSQLVYACNGNQVSHSWVAGATVIERGGAYPYQYQRPAGSHCCLAGKNQLQRLETT